MKTLLLIDLAQDFIENHIAVEDLSSTRLPKADLDFFTKALAVQLAWSTRLPFRGPFH